MASTEAHRVETTTTEKESQPSIKFEGKSSEGYEDFKIGAKLELAFEDSDLKKRKMLVKMLGIPARRNLVANEPDMGYLAIADYWQALDATYADGSQQARAAAALEPLKQGSTPIGEFIVKFDELCGNANVTGTVRTSMFINKLNKGLQDRLITTGLTDYQELKSRAQLLAPFVEQEYRRYQKTKDTMRETKQSKGRGRGGPYRDQQGRYQPQQARDGQGKPQGQGNPWNQRGRGRGSQIPRPTQHNQWEEGTHYGYQGETRKTIVCWNCNKEGHMAYQCEQQDYQGPVQHNAVGSGWYENQSGKGKGRREDDAEPQIEEL